MEQSIRDIARKYDIAIYHGEDAEEVINRLGLQAAQLIHAIAEMSGCTVAEAAEGSLSEIGFFTVTQEQQ